MNEALFESRNTIMRLPKQLLKHPLAWVSSSYFAEGIPFALVIWVAGADNHSNDRFGKMYLSVKDLKRRDEVLLRAFMGNQVPVAVLYGGGFNRQSDFTAKIHRNTVKMAKQLAGEYRGI